MDGPFAAFRVTKQRHVTIADPHPWHEDVYELEIGTFMTSWRSARAQGGPLWAARLSAA